MPRSPRQVWFLVTPRTSLLNVSGPWDVLGHANDVLGRAAYELTAFGSSGPTATTRYGILVSGLRPLPLRSTRLPQVVVVAGASPATPLPPDHAPLVPWIRRHHERIPRVVSICTGAFALGEAGVLNGRRATTHWLYLKHLQERFPAARVVDDGIYTKDGKVWTSAGATAGIDLMLAMVEEDQGHDVAIKVAKRMVLFLRRSGNQAQFSSTLLRQEKEVKGESSVATFVLEHLDQDLSVERVASGVGMSARTLSRWCRQHLDESPAELVRRLRVEEARRLLETTSLPVKDITARTGMGDASTMWRVFMQDLGVTPAEYRQRFAVRGDADVESASNL